MFYWYLYTITVISLHRWWRQNSNGHETSATITPKYGTPLFSPFFPTGRTNIFSTMEHKTVFTIKKFKVLYLNTFHFYIFTPPLSNPGLWARKLIFFLCVFSWFLTNYRWFYFTALFTLLLYYSDVCLWTVYCSYFQKKLLGEESAHLCIQLCLGKARYDRERLSVPSVPNH